MKTYWDTSAAINAVVSPEVYARLASGEHVTRLHLLGEFFAIMTGRGIEVLDEAGQPDRLTMGQKECAAWLKRFAGKLQFDELDSNSVLEALDKAQSRGVQGSQVYDYWHVLVSAKANADEILTRNGKHFAPLNQSIGGQAKVQWP